MLLEFELHATLRQPYIILCHHSWIDVTRFPSMSSPDRANHPLDHVTPRGDHLQLDIPDDVGHPALADRCLASAPETHWKRP